MATERPASIINQLRELWSKGGQLIEGLAVSRGVPSSYEHLLTSLKTVLQDTGDMVHMLHNQRLPVHRVPPEVLIRIFSFVKISVDDPDSAHPAPVRWTITVHDDRKLHPLLLVCRKWRDLALNTPLLWSHVMVVPGMSDDYLARSASVPLTVYISGAISLSTTRLLASGGMIITQETSPSSFYQSLKSIGKIHSRIRVLHINFADSINISWIAGFVATLGAHQLEECSIRFPSERSRLDGGFQRHVSRPRLTLFSGGWGNSGGEKLRSLHLASVPFLPSNRFPALTTLSLSNATIIASVYGGSRVPRWGLQDLVDFLSGSPRLEELYIRNVDLELRDLPFSGTTRVTLGCLRQLVLDVPLHTHISAVQRAFSIIGYPGHCHVLLTTFSASQPDDIVAQLLTTLPCTDSYTRLRIRAVEDEHTTLHFVPASGNGSLSMCLRVTDQPYARTVPFNPQRELRALFDRAYPWCCAVEELWLELAEDDYYYGLRCVLGRFPSLRRLVVSQPCYVSPGGWYAHIAEALHLLHPARNGTVACPALDTLCINIPAYCKDVEAVKQVLLSRARSHPVRRLVVGYNSMLEWDVLEEVFSLEELVEEFVCEELPPARRDTVLADWLLSIPQVFEEGGFHADWPKRGSDASMW
ncbi:hypothetical protein K466DRAFT_117987 [Polyporus arcularius HHB13444]|uniref:F-box domain-containing protein n=1 Tax=Polyporus arcularius HHB13444 TaxID=1314778 RepID=A0A5C3Q3Q2_9APHY|nr:hypothetical protein K466DRAFT_117987 [Polyporus arcularius HHB13444]